MKIEIPHNWAELLKDQIESPYFKELMDFVESEYNTHTIYPQPENIFRALHKCPLDSLKVVIIGQDPYHGEGQANGLCFSVNNDVKFPPSLRNIFKEIAEETSKPAPLSGNLDRWAEQGVLLLNSVLTVRAHEAASHAGRGWERFTNAIVEAISKEKDGVVYMLWGGYAQKVGSVVDSEKNCILKSVHPSPLSVYRGFWGCNHFIDANKYLNKTGKTEIDW